MKKILVAYYSRTGNTRKIGKEIAKELNADIEEVIDLNKRKGIVGWVFGGKDALLKKETQIKIKKDASKYDLVILGSPVWVGTIVPAIRTYLMKFKFKKVAFFCTYGGGISNTFNEMEKLSKKPIAMLGLLDKDIKKNIVNDKIKGFCNRLK